MTIFLCIWIFLSIIITVSCACARISEVNSVLETQTGQLWNITIAPTSNWTYHAVKINGLDITTNHNLQDDIESYFSLKTDRNTSLLSFTVDRVLNKEDHFWINANKGDLTDLEFIVVCTDTSTKVPTSTRVIVTSVNEFQHEFNATFPSKITVSENSPQNSTIFSIFPFLVDQDVPKPTKTNFSYILEPTNTQNDGNAWFRIRVSSSDGIQIEKSPDFDQLSKQNMSILSVVVVVKANDDSGFSINRTLQIEILDVDDLPPAFIYPGCSNCTNTPFTAATGPKYRGTVRNISPVKIEAKDQDSLSSVIIYTIQQSPSNFHTSFRINQHNAEIEQIGDVMNTDVLTIMAREDTPNSFFQTATLLIRLSNDSVYFPSTSPDNSDKLNIIAIIVGAVSLVIIGILIFLIVFVYKRTKKKMMVSPDQGDNSPRTLSEDLESEKAPSVEEKVGNWKQAIDPEQWPPAEKRRQELDPLPTRDESTETDSNTKKKKKQRKKKKRLMEIFDGTKQFEDKAEPEFFQDPEKKKIKRSTKSKNKRTDNGPLVVGSD